MAFNQNKPLDLLYLGTFDYYLAEVKFGGIQVSGGLVLNDVRNNIRIGVDAVASATTGTYNIGFGAEALKYLTVGTRNTALGQMAMTDAGGPLCSDNLAVGYMASSNVANAQRCVVLGTYAAQNAENPVDMVIIGTNAVGNPALPLGYDAANCVIIGNGAGYNGPANYNVIIGYEAGFSMLVPAPTPVDNGRKNVAVGYKALHSALSPDRCVVIGSEAAYGASDGTDLVVIGTQALAGTNAQTEVSSVVIGNSAGYTSGGSYNVICGYESGYTVPHGADENIFLGYRSARAVAGASTKNTVIGSACCTWPDAGQTGNAGTMTMSSSIAIGTDCNRRNGAASDHAVNLVRTTLMGVECGYCTTRSLAATLTDCVFIGQRSGTFAVPITALNSSVAIGNQCAYSGSGTITDTVVIGHTATTNSNNTVVVGSISSSTAANTVVMGYNSKAQQPFSVVIGQASEGTQSSVVAIGDACKAHAVYAVAIGSDCTVAGNGSVAIGTNSGGTAAAAVMIGDTCTADANSVVVVGSGCQAHGANAVVVGQGASSTGGTGTIVIGQSSTSTAGDNSIVIGQGSTSGVANAVVMGQSASSAGGSATVVIGQNSTVTAGSNSVVVGQGSSSATENAIVIGQNSHSTSGNNSVVIGQGSSSAAGNAVAIGFICQSTADDTVVIGKQSSSAAIQSVVMGTLASTTSTSSVVIGYNSHATGVGTHDVVVIGDSCNTASNNSVVIGRSCSVIGPNSVAIGSNANAGDFNVCVGMYSGAAGPDAYNTLIGYHCGASLTVQTPVDDGCFNTMLGYRSGESLQTTTKKTVVIGADCCRTINDAQKMTAVSSVAIGDKCVYRGGTGDYPVNLDSTVVIGSNSAACPTRTAAAQLVQSVFVGCSAGAFSATNTTMTNNIAIGYNCGISTTAAAVDDIVLIGSTCTTSGNSSVVIGTVGSGAVNSVVIGNYGVGGAQAVVIGTSGEGATDSVVIGSTGQGAANAVAIGTNCQAAQNAVVLGYASYCGLNDAVAIGTNACAGQFSVYIGNGPRPGNGDTGAYNVMIGFENGFKASYLSQYNVFAGYRCCYDPTSTESLGCGQCVILGANAAVRIGSARDVVCVGNNAMGSTSGSGYAAQRVVCIGTLAGYNRPGNDVICIGQESGKYLASTGATDGTNIICMGNYAGSRLLSTSGSFSSHSSTILGTSCCTTSSVTSYTTALQSVAIGNMCAYTDKSLNLSRTVVIGHEAAKCTSRTTTASYTDCVVLGTQAGALPSSVDNLLSCVVVGTNAASTGNNAVVIGTNCTAVGSSCVVIGDTSKANSSTVAIGSHCGTNGNTTNSVVMGANACNTENAALPITCTSSTVIGDSCAYRAATDDRPVNLENTVVIGYKAASCAARTTAAAITDSVFVGNSVGFFPSTITSVARCITVGKGCSFTWAGDEVLGYELSDHVLIGNGATTDNNSGAVVIGNGASAGGQGVAFGTNAHAASNGVAIGCDSSAAVGSIAVGQGAVASDVFTTVIGCGGIPFQTTTATIHGYTRIGGGSDIYVPAVKTILFEGTTGAVGTTVTVQRNLGSVFTPSYLTAAQMISISGVIANNETATTGIPPFMYGDVNNLWELFYTPGGSGGVAVRLGASATKLATRPFRVLIVYTE